jgi:hypothetical protein
MKIEMGKKYTSDGKNLRVVCIDREDKLGYNVVGVFDNGDIKCFKSNGDGVFAKYNLQEAWQPQEGEWCWFWDDEDYNYFVLAKFAKMTESGRFYNNGWNDWTHCVKFNGDFSEHMKLINGEIK